MARPLKVFRAHLGFYDSVVAKPSRKAALEAWGSRRDLFREGFAEETNDPEPVKAALARPGVVLRRAFGSPDPFLETPAPPKLRGVKTDARAKAAARDRELARQKEKKREAALAKLAAEEAGALKEIARRRAKLDAEADEVKRQYARKRQALADEAGGHG